MCTHIQGYETHIMNIEATKAKRKLQIPTTYLHM